MIDYLWQFVSFLLIVFGPVPCVVAITRLRRCAVGTPCLSHDCLMALTAWCAMEVLIGLLLGSMQCLRLNALLLSEAALLLAGTAALYYVRCRPLVRQEHSLPKEFDSSLFLMGILMLIGTGLLWSMLISPIIDFDSLWYHLPTIVDWYQSGTLSLSDHDTMPAYYPYLGVAEPAVPLAVSGRSSGHLSERHRLDSAGIFDLRRE